MYKKLICLSFSLVLAGQFTYGQMPGSGNSLDFDGVDDYVNLNSHFTNLTVPFTIAAWIKPAQASLNQTIFYSHGHGNSYVGGWLQYRNGKLAVGYGDGTVRNSSGRRVAQATVAYNSNQWVHVTGVVRGPTDMDIYVNGNSQTVSYNGSGGSMVTNTATGWIGGYIYNNATDYYAGEIEELSLWNSALTATDVRDLMCSKLTGNEPSLIAYYDFDTNTGSNLNNLVANGIDGTLQNNPTWVGSSAPVGDRSQHNYTSNGTAIGFSPAADSVVAKLQGTGDDGIHVYFVDQKPNPLPSTQVVPNAVNHYFGVFAADPNRSYNLEYYVNNPALPSSSTYSLANRPHNASANWTALAPSGNPINLNNRNAPEQFVLVSKCSTYDLVPKDTVACDSITFSFGAPFHNITWFDGSTANPRTFRQNTQAWFSASDTSAGCPVRDSVNIQLISTNNFSVFPNDTLICNDSRVKLNAYVPGATNYQWSNGRTDSVVSFNTPGIKWVQVFISGNCSFRDSIDVSFSAAVDPIAENEFLLCPGKRIDFSVDQLQYINVNWSNGSSQYQTTYNSAGQHWVQVEKPDGCTFVDSFKIVEATPLDSVVVFEDTIFCKDEPFFIYPPDSMQVIWPNGSDSSYYVSREQVIKVFVTDGCHEDVQFFEAIETNCGCDVVMPNAFTPNNDGLNDYFAPTADCNFQKYNIKIFNRWGTLLFESNNPEEKFDGTFNGNKLPQGVYVYRLTYNTDRVEGIRSGHLTLMR